MVGTIDPLKSSTFLSSLRAARRLTFPVRALTEREIQVLIGQGCLCDDWSLVKVAERFSPERVRETRFRGKVILGRQYGWVNLEGSREPAGIERTTLEDAWVEDGAVIRDTTLVSRMRVGHGVAILGCGRITHRPGSHFGVGTPIALIETGGRVTRFFPEMTLDQAAGSARPGGNVRALAAYLRKVEAYLARSRSDHGVIQAHSRILDTPRLENVFVGASARIEGATRVSDSVILSDSEHPTVIEDGALVSESGVQWGCRVSSLSV
ncbi:MAG: DUF4954 family protein, partial [Candidatus Omnitrophica bacterium]|nr:DUF4954 family protein [Candidatus Omnitrophota bacterium]